MNRLTYKLDEPIKTKYLNYEYNRIKDYDIDRCNFGRITDDMIFNKLGKLEDIEEELGIDLITLFKVFKSITKREPLYVDVSAEGNGLGCGCGNRKIEMFDFINDKIMSGKSRYYATISIVNQCVYINKRIQDIIEGIYYFKDYGKTWALTRKELEND